jgi:hypothetical protein
MRHFPECVDLILHREISINRGPNLQSGPTRPEPEREGPAFGKFPIGQAGADAALEVLRRDGIVRIRAAYGTDTLTRAIQDFRDRIEDVAPDPFGHAQIGGMADDGVLRGSLCLSRLVSAPIVRAVVRGYLGTQSHWSFWRAYRLEPLPPKLYRAFQPHVDGHLHELKAMVLLTHTDETQQCMMYWKGTHKIDWRICRSADTVFGPRLSSRLADPFLATGEPGDIILFDTNGIHAGQRNLTARRDTSVANFSATAFSYPVPSLHSTCVGELDQDELCFYRAAAESADNERAIPSPREISGSVVYSSVSSPPILEGLCEQAWEDRLDRARADDGGRAYLRYLPFDKAMIQAAHGDLNLPQHMEAIERIVERDRAIGVVRDQNFSLPAATTAATGVGPFPGQESLARRVADGAAELSGPTSTHTEQFRLLLLDMSVCIAEASDRKYLLNSLALTAATLAYLLRFPASDKLAPLSNEIVKAFRAVHRD